MDRRDRYVMERRIDRTRKRAADCKAEADRNMASASEANERAATSEAFAPSSPCGSTGEGFDAKE
ncbi:hypothetical protein [Paenibacillus sp. NPDC058071]|uniref:hypothetical protein n=1 Tax=Paenibacillus sp. NPDC058071 TaxID=3346326 RepID=UPI0036D9B635